MVGFNLSVEKWWLNSVYQLKNDGWTRSISWTMMVELSLSVEKWWLNSVYQLKNDGWIQFISWKMMVELSLSVEKCLMARISNFYIWGFPARKMGVPLDRWMVFVRENPKLKWMRTGGSPISGNLHIPFNNKAVHNKRELAQNNLCFRAYWTTRFIVVSVPFGWVEFTPMLFSKVSWGLWVNPQWDKKCGMKPNFHS